MTATPPAIHECYVCGKRAKWGPTWMTYGTLRDQEDFGFCIKVCSEQCKDKLPDVEAAYDAEVSELGKRTVLRATPPASAKFKNGDIVRIDWSKVGLSNGNFARWVPRDPLKVLYAMAPSRISVKQVYMVEDARGLLDAVAEEVLMPASARARGG